MIQQQVPKIERILIRPRLEQAMELAIIKRLMLVWGIPGAGKTALVSDFLKRKGYPFFWYSIDEAVPNCTKLINSLVCFINSLLSVSMEINQINTTSIQQMSSSFIDYVESLDLEEDIFVVLDNYHIVEADEFDNLIQLLIDKCILNIHFIVISRKKPSWNLIEKKLDRKILEINAKQLTFTLRETKEFYKEIYNLDFGEDEILFLHQLTKGWVAAMVIIGEKLLLAELNVQELMTEDFNLVINMMPDLKTYLEQEFFIYLSNTEKDLVLTISMAEEISVELVGYIFRDETTTLFNIILSGKLPVTYIDKMQMRYRFHPLWQAFLFDKVCNTWAIERINELHSLIGSYYFEKGEWKESLSHYIEGHNSKQAIFVLKQAGLEILDCNLSEKLNILVSQVNINQFDDPWLYFIYACTFRGKDYDLCYHYLNKAIRRFREVNDIQGEIQALCLQNENLMFVLGTLKQMNNLVLRIKSLKSEINLEMQLLGCKEIYTAWSHCYLTGQLEEALRLGEKARIISKITQNNNLNLWSSYILVLASVFKGEFKMAQGVISAVFDEGFENVNDRLIHVLFPYIAGLNANYKGDFEEAKIFFEMAVKKTKRLKVEAVEFYIGNFINYATYYLDGIIDTDLIEKTTLNVSRYFFEENYHLNSYSLCWKAHYAFLQNQSHKAVALGWQALELRCKAGGEIYILQCHLVLGAALRDIDDLDEAEYHLLRAQEISIAISSSFFLNSCYVQLALLYEAMDDKDRFIEYAKKTASLASRKGYYHFYLWRNSDLIKLVNLTKHIKILKGYFEILCDHRPILVDAVERKVTSDGTAISKPQKYLQYLKLYMLGTFSLEIDGKKINNTGAIRVLYLLKYLCIKRKPCSIEEIIDIMWPEWDPKQAKNNFYFTLHRLRKILTDKKIVIFENGLCYIKSEFYWTDVEQFNCLIKRSKEYYIKKQKTQALELMDQARTLYRGELLKGESLDTTLSLEREFIAKKYYNLLVKQSEILIETGNYKKAGEILTKALLSPFCEEYTYRLLMLTYYKMNNQCQALIMYKELTDYLFVNMGIKPSRVTEILRKRIINRQDITFSEIRDNVQ